MGLGWGLAGHFKNLWNSQTKNCMRWLWRLRPWDPDPAVLSNLEINVKRKLKVAEQKRRNRILCTSIWSLKSATLLAITFAFLSRTGKNYFAAPSTLSFFSTVCTLYLCKISKRKCPTLSLLSENSLARDTFLGRYCSYLFCESINL